MKPEPFPPNYSNSLCEIDLDLSGHPSSFAMDYGGRKQAVGINLLGQFFLKEWKYVKKYTQPDQNVMGNGLGFLSNRSTTVRSQLLSPYWEALRRRLPYFPLKATRKEEEVDSRLPLSYVYSIPLFPETW